MLLSPGVTEYSKPWINRMFLYLESMEYSKPWIHGILRALELLMPRLRKRGSVCTGISLGRSFGFHPHWDTRNAQCHYPFPTPTSIQPGHSSLPWFPRNGRASPAQDTEEIPGTGAAGLGGGWMELGLGRAGSGHPWKNPGATSKSPDSNRASPLELFLILDFGLDLHHPYLQGPTMGDLRLSMENIRRAAPVNPVPRGICLWKRPTQLENSKEPKVELLQPAWKAPSSA